MQHKIEKKPHFGSSLVALPSPKMHQLRILTVFAVFATVVKCNEFYALNSQNGCLVIPKQKIWPYDINVTDYKNVGIPDTARIFCNRLGMSLAQIYDDTSLLLWKSK